jgi:N-acetyl-anhydromuramyl-L-alanine amidase AmpD
VLKLGSTGNYVTQWQEWLNTNGYPCGAADGVFGQRVDGAVRAFQNVCGLKPDGVVGTETFKWAVEHGWPAPEGWPLILSKHFTAAQRGPSDVDYIVIHTMEVEETDDMEHEISSRFAADTSPQASTHFCVGEELVIQNVLLNDVAWHAEKANRRGIGIEHVGTASQNDAQWADDFSSRMLALSAKLTAELCRRYNIPVGWLDGDAIARSERGITGHSQVNDFFKGPGQGHRDPGPHWPAAQYLSLVRAAETS